MNGENATGTLTLGLWQQPAALILAGRVTPDPYPLEQILYCATCGQQFFGTHLTGDADLADGTRITGVHLTRGTRVADRIADGADQPGGGRVYRTSCDCRPGPPLASEVELRVYAEAHVLAFGTDTISGLTSTHYALLAVRIFSRVEVGPTVDDMTFMARI
jgi:hypothetical protein